MSDYTRTTSQQTSGASSRTGGGVPKDIGEKFPIYATKDTLVVSYSQFSPQKIIVEALHDLLIDGYALNEPNYMSNLHNSHDLLNALGFELVSKENIYGLNDNAIQLSKNFSLKNTINLDSTIDNSKIVDPDLSSLTPEPVNANDKFKSETDSFYELDDEKNDNIKNFEQQYKRTKEKKLFKIAELMAREVRKSNNKMLNKQTNKGGMRL